MFLVRPHTHGARNMVAKSLALLFLKSCMRTCALVRYIHIVAHSGGGTHIPVRPFASTQIETVSMADRPGHEAPWLLGRYRLEPKAHTHTHAHV